MKKSIAGDKTQGDEERNLGRLWHRLRSGAGTQVKKVRKAPLWHTSGTKCSAGGQSWVWPGQLFVLRPTTHLCLWTGHLLLMYGRRPNLEGEGSNWMKCLCAFSGISVTYVYSLILLIIYFHCVSTKPRSLEMAEARAGSVLQLLWTPGLEEEGVVVWVMREKARVQPTAEQRVMLFSDSKELSWARVAGTNRM